MFDFRISGRNNRQGGAYLFLEESSRLDGVRLFLRKLRGETNHDLITAMTRRHLSAGEDLAKGPKFLVTFAIEKSFAGGSG